MKLDTAYDITDSEDIPEIPRREEIRMTSAKVKFCLNVKVVNEEDNTDR